MAKSKSEALAPDVEITESGGNIFADLGFPNSETVEAKALLSLQIEQVMEQKSLTHAEAAQKTGLPQAGISDLLRGGFNGFTIEQLSQVLTALQKDV